LAVISHLNAPKLAYSPHKGSSTLRGERLHVFQDDQVRFFGQPVAVVIADTLDQAEHAAAAIHVDYEVRTPDLRIEGVETLPAGSSSASADKARGDADAALSQAPVKVDAVYRIAREITIPWSRMRPSPPGMAAV
jgi:xanthine dehydrogenase YagR molybdenum-binding subunit